MSEDKGRTNYVRVKDPAAFTAEMEDLALEVITDEKNGETLYGVMTANDDQGWPSMRENAEGEAEDIWMAEIIAAHLVDGEVCVMINVGSDKMRSLWGNAWAFDSTGKEIQIGLSDIYREAKKVFGKDPTAAEY